MTGCVAARVASDYRDLVIEMLSDENANLIAFAHSLDHDVTIYQQIAKACLDEMHAVHIELDRLRRDRDWMRDENRRLREDWLLRAGADEEA